MRTLSALDGGAVYLIAILADLIIQLAGGFVLLALPGGASVTVQLTLMIVVQLGFFLPVVLYARGKRAALCYRVKRLGAATAALCPLVAALCVVGFVIPADAFSRLMERIGFTAAALEPNGALEMTLFVLDTLLFAPIAEELVFRGALLGSLTKRFSPLAAIALDGLAFSLMHMNPAQTVYQFFLGCACAYVVMCSRSVLASMLVHCSSNAVALVLSFVPAEVAAFSLPAWAEIAAGVVLAAAATAAIVTLGRAFGREKDRDGGLILAFGKTADDDKNGTWGAKNAESLFSRAVKRPSASADGRGVSAMISIGFAVCAFVWAFTLYGGIIA